MRRGDHTPHDGGAVNIRDRIKAAEGWRSKPYPDPLFGWSVPTFGYGFTHLTEAEGEEILTNRIHAAWDTAIQFCGVEAWARLNGVRQDVITEMAYNLGAAKLAQFTKLQAALQARFYHQAADEIIDSLAYRQLPRRYSRLAREMRTGELEG